MKIYKINFEPVYPVGNTLIIAANNLGEAAIIASDTLVHIKNFTIEEVDISKPCVIEYLSGDY